MFYFDTSMSTIMESGHERRSPNVGDQSHSGVRHREFLSDMDLLKDRSIMSVTGERITDISAVLEEKLLALFFSSSWCLATRQFLPLFKQFCADVTKRKGRFKVLCVPFDKTEDDMWAFYEDMPKDWMTLALAEQEAITDLREKYRVNVVPKLVVVNTDDGELISCMARKEIQDKGVAAYRLWYDVFRPSLLKRKMRAAVRVVLVMQGMQNNTNDGEKQENVLLENDDQKDKNY